jgi:6-phosphogluconolactonase
VTDRSADVRVLAGPDDLAAAAADLFVGVACAAVEAGGRFAVALAGGSTPRVAYDRLAREPLRSRVPWQAVQVFWGDERHVPPDHPDSNYGMARKAVLAHVPLPAEAVHRVPAEDPDATAAAEAYEREVRRVLRASRDAVPRFDLILLGMGADGHTASLFPGGAAVRERRLVVAERVEKVGGWRITFTLPLLNAAALVVFIVSGTEKAAALRAVLEPGQDADPPPAACVRPERGTLVWLVDEAAARLLTAARTGRRRDGPRGLGTLPDAPRPSRSA